MVERTKNHLDSIFHALSDPTRRSILRDLSGGEKTVSEIAKFYPITLAATSKHLNVLESARLISRERRGNFQIVRITPSPFRQAEEWLAFYEKLWNQTLDAMQTALEEEGNANE